MNFTMYTYEVDVMKNAIVGEIWEFDLTIYSIHTNSKPLACKNEMLDRTEGKKTWRCTVIFLYVDPIADPTLIYVEYVDPIESQSIHIYITSVVYHWTWCVRDKCKQKLHFFW